MQKVELESTLHNVLSQLATLYFVARQVVHKPGNTRNIGFQLAIQQCCESSSRKNVARITGPLLLLIILFYSNEPSIYLHLPLGSHSFLSYATISLLYLDVYVWM